MTKGIDVSHWQGTIDWNKVKAAGIEFILSLTAVRSSSEKTVPSCLLIEQK